ncbi:hypothetical protein V3C99_009529, partial [Haemonchus contortus]
IIVDCNLAQVTENMLLYMLIALILPSIMVDGYPHYLEDQYRACSPWIYIPQYKKCYKKFCAEKHYNDHKNLCKGLGARMANICSHEENHVVALLSRFHNRPNGDWGTNERPTFIGLHNYGGWTYQEGMVQCGFRAWSARWNEPSGFSVNTAGFYSSYRDIYDEWSADYAPWQYGNVMCEIPDCTVDKLGIL